MPIKPKVKFKMVIMFGILFFNLKMDFAKEKKMREENEERNQWTNNGKKLDWELGSQAI